MTPEQQLCPPPSTLLCSLAHISSPIILFGCILTTSYLLSLALSCLSFSPPSLHSTLPLTRPRLRHSLSITLFFPLHSHSVALYHSLLLTCALSLRRWANMKNVFAALSFLYKAPISPPMPPLLVAESQIATLLHPLAFTHSVDEATEKPSHTTRISAVQ